MYDKIIEQCNSNKSGYFIKENGFKHNWPNLYKEVIEYSFIDELRDSEFKIRLWHYLHQVFDIPKNECGRSLSFKNFRVGYSQFCATNCKCMSLHNTIKKRENCKIKYGVDHPMKLEENKKKISEAKLSYDDNKKHEINEKRKSTFIKNHGVDNPNKNAEIVKRRVESFKKNIEQWKESYKNTSIDRYGVEHPLSSDKIRDKYKDTMTSRYGEDNPNKVESIRNKTVNSNISKYGCEHPFQSNEVKTKIKETLLKKYNVTNVSHIPEIKQKISDGVKNSIKSKTFKKYPNITSFNEHSIIVRCDINDCKCGGLFEIPKGLYFQRIKFNVNPCIISNPINKIGISQSSVSTFISTLGVDFIENNRKILNGKEIDILIPEHSLGIEFNGVYWHGELHKDKTYHQEKTKIGLINGINLFHIWEDDWQYKQNIVKSMIKSKLHLSEYKLGARKCQIREVSSKESKSFLEMNHLQGNVNSSIRLGLYYNDELVSLMTFGRLRKTLNQQHVENEYELYRYANKLDTNVQGGFSRLLNHFIQEYSPRKIHTYANMDHSNGNVYVKNGFTLDHITNPGYHWVVDGIRRHRFNYRKDLLVKSGADPSKTEMEIMYERGHYRIWDSGNIKFTKTCN